MKAATTLPQRSSARPDHRDLRHRLVQRQAAFDLDRRDVLAAGDDHVVDPAGDEQIAVLVEIAGVAGEVPAVAQRLGVGVGPPPVAFEGFVAREQRDDLAFLAGLRDVVGRGGAQLHHPHHLVDAGAAGGAGLCRRVLVDGEGVDLRGAVVVDEQLRLERRLQLLEQTVGHRARRQSRACAPSSRRSRLKARMMHQVVIERRHQIEVGDLLGRDQLRARAPRRSAAGRRTCRRSSDMAISERTPMV